MRHAGSRSGIFVCWLGLYGLGACGVSRHASVSTPVRDEACQLSAPPSRAADTAALLFTVGAGEERHVCALRLAAAALRPWASASRERWAIRVVLTDGGASVQRLDAERARDAVDSGQSLVATEDLDLVAYASARRGLDVTPLPWDRTYFHLAPGSIDALGVRPSADAVRVDARTAEASSCETRSDTTSKSARAPSTRIVYEAGDRTARELAERAVALVHDRTAAAVPLSPAELETALRAGDELAYIVSLPRSPDAGCVALTELAQRTSWITPRAITPLIDTRAYAIVPQVARP